MNLIVPLVVGLCGRVTLAYAPLQTDRRWRGLRTTAGATLENCKQKLFAFRIDGVAILIDPSGDDQRIKAPRMIVHR